MNSRFMALGLDLSKSAAEAVAEGFGTGIWYVLLVVLLGALYFAQQRMVAARASISPTMSAGQAKLMQYLPVFFAIFQIFFLAALVVYYLFQTVFRILQQAYITRAFYGHDESLGRQAQRAGEAAREEAKNNQMAEGAGSSPRPSVIWRDRRPTIPSRARRSRPTRLQERQVDRRSCEAGKPSKRVTPPKNRPTPSSGAKGRPTPSRQEAQANKAKSSKKSSKNSRPKSSKKSS